MRQNCTIITLILFLSAFCHVKAMAFDKKDSIEYIQPSDMPDFLPNPPDVNDWRYCKDYIRYQWGKMQRNTERGKLAIANRSMKLGKLLNNVSGYYTMADMQTAMPKTYSIVCRMVNSNENLGIRAKSRVFRIRPYVEFNEGTLMPDFEEHARGYSGYPSGHALRGWAFALLLDELNPMVQDSLFATYYEYGTSRVISGFHYQSDVDQGYIIGASGFIRIHSDSLFMHDLEQAKAEIANRYPNATYAGNSDSSQGFLTNEQYINKLDFLPNYPDSLDPLYYNDCAYYKEGVSKRDGADAEQTCSDNDISVENILPTFSDAFGSVIDQQTMPSLYTLLQRALRDVKNQTSILSKARKFRVRPCNIFPMGGALDESINKEAAKTSSYPSEQAMAGILYASVLAYINTEHQDPIWKRGYQIGNSAVINGMNFQSDVDDARILGTMLMARLLRNPDFYQQLNTARKEYKDVVTGVQHVKAQVASQNSLTYNLGGQRISKARPDEIVVNGGRKFVKR